MARCAECGKKENFPYTCKFCDLSFCSEHRLPENHNCEGLESYKQGMQREGRMFEEKEVLNRGSRSFADRVTDALPFSPRGNVAFTLLAAMVIVYILQQLTILFGPSTLHNDLFVLGPGLEGFLRRPWTLITSMFSHAPGNIWHILVNGMVLFFFGPTLERLVGSKRFAALFFVAGVAAGLGFVAATGASVLGASGAIFGVMGALTALRPNMRVYVNFLIPMPLWVLTLLYAAFSLVMIPSGGSTGVADLAHLIGLVVGLAWGFSVKDDVPGGGRGGALGGPGSRRGRGPGGFR